MTLYYADQFVLPLPPGHRFPMEKYARLRGRVAGGTLSPKEIRAIGFPWSPQMVRSRRSAGATVAAARDALVQGWSANLARVTVIDCDVHQGNGTAAILRGDDPVFTFSIHGARNFPFEGDRLGRLRLTKRGLARRDEMVLGALAAHGIPVAIAMAGGYGRDIDDTVAIHAATILTAKRLLG